MNRKSLLLWLLLISWTVSFAQTPGLVRVPKDTVRCYTPTELKAIALKLISGAECDTLLKVSRLENVAKDTVIASQGRTIVKQDLRQVANDHLVNELDIKIVGLNKDKKKLKLKLVLTQVGWAITTVGLGVLTVLALVN